MSKAKAKKVVRVQTDKNKSGAKAKVSSKQSSKLTAMDFPLIFDKTNYYYFLTAVVLMFVGMLLMSGGKMPSPDVWEPERIYSFRRITLAPIVILSALVVAVFGIFKK